MRKVRYPTALLTVMVFCSFFLMASGFVFTDLWSNTREKIVYEQAEPVYVVVDKIVEKDVYRQETPIVPVKKSGKEVILLDKSGSMKDFVTELYTSNVSFFTNNDVWSFDTQVFKDITVDDIEFGGDTNLTQAVNAAVEEGYDTIWLCSDLEHNTGSLEFVDKVKDVNIIVYSPKILDESKTKKTIEALSQKEAHIKIITMS